MEVTFREAKIEDIAGIVNLCNECFEENTKTEKALEIFRKTENDPNNIYINGLIDGKVVAHAKMTVIKTIYKPMETYAILNHVCVHPDYRRHHLATHLLDVLFKIAKDYNCVSVELWSKNFRTAAHACYKRYGFDMIDAGFFEKKVN